MEENQARCRRVTGAVTLAHGFPGGLPLPGGDSLRVVVDTPEIQRRAVVGLFKVAIAPMKAIG